MRLFRMLLAAAAVLAISAPPVAAQSAPAKIEIKSFGSLSIKKESVPVGCTVLHIYGLRDEDERGEITCDTQAQFDDGFTVASNFSKACAPTKDNKVLCTITKSK